MKFFLQKDKVKQDTKLSHLIEIGTPKRRRRLDQSSSKNRNITVHYNLWTSSGKVKVCQKMFLKVFGISQKRIQNISKQMKVGSGIVENRGGDRRSHKNVEKREKVKTFIAHLKGTESHYGRAKSQRIYLSSEYNITILHKLYNDGVDERYKVNYKFFSRIFLNNFNIGFGTPATDVCSFCTRHLNQLSMIKDQSKKQMVITQLRVHKLRAKQFYSIMKEKPENGMSFCFDLQQVQVLPKVPISDAFYAQQLSFYVFCVTDVACKQPIFYSWLEHQAGRGATEVGSALYDFLKKTEFPESVKELTLFSDGCGGQNKNSHIVHMLMVWLHKHAPETLKSIRMIFPVRGHSYLPADRIFGRCEKLIRSHSTIKSPEKYYELYSKVGLVRKLGTEWEICDIKSALCVFKKLEAISQVKRIFIRRTSNHRVAVKTEMFYRNDDESTKYQTLIKKNKRIDNVNFPTLPLHHKIKGKKLKSLHNLLEQFSSENWRDDKELQWLIPVFPEKIEALENLDIADCNDNDDQQECTCIEDDGGVKV